MCEYLPLISLMVEFCNEWPKALSTDEICDKLFPIEVITRDIVADGSSLRDPRARVVTVQVIAVSVEQLVEILVSKSQHKWSKAKLLSCESSPTPPADSI